MNLDRIKNIVYSERDNDSVIYIMHNAFRIQYNHALFHAINHNKTLTVYLIEPFDENPKVKDFFIQGIHNYKKVFKKLGIEAVYIQRDYDLRSIINDNTDVVMDMPYLKEEKALASRIKDIVIKSDSSLTYVETNVLVPVTVASDKEEYGARTIRTKIHKLLSEFIDPVLGGEDQFTYEETASNKIEEFIERKLQRYDLKNAPELSYTSEISAYLKYGFISPLSIYMRVLQEQSDNKNTFIEELIVRRELAYNFVYYNEAYDLFEGMTYEWAYKTMDNHIFDNREYLYSIEDYLQFKTHDKYFNSAMKEMVYLGKMHGYMRMYWCKKIIEWSKSYREAYQTAIQLNNYYFLDGNTPNGFAGVAWCFGKHDRAWPARQIFGKLRYMNQNGLKRKFDIDQYCIKIDKEIGDLNG